MGEWGKALQAQHSSHKLTMWRGGVCFSDSHFPPIFISEMGEDSTGQVSVTDIDVRPETANCSEHWVCAVHTVHIRGDSGGGSSTGQASATDRIRGEICQL